MWVYPPNCRTKVGARWSPSFPRQSLARRRARNIVQVHAHALNGSWECYHVFRIGLGAIWGDHGRRRSLHFTTPHFCLKKGWVYPLCPFPLKNKIKLPNGWRTIISLVHKIRLHSRRGKGMAESFSREKLRHAPQKEGGREILCDLPPV